MKKNKLGMLVVGLLLMGTTSFANTIEERVTSNESSISANEENIRQNMSLALENEGKIEDTQKEVGKNSKSITENGMGIARNTDNIEVNRKDIAKNKGSINENTKDIKNTNERVDRMDSRISGIEQKLGQTRSEMKRIGAQSAAMTSAAVSAVANLEPGEIGVGAGYGSYGGKDAISISIGTRVSENVNGSWSRTGGSESNDMYGVGVGYKFSFKS